MSTDSRIRQLEIAIFILGLLICAYIIYLFFHKELVYNDSKLQSKLDSMIAHDRIRDSTNVLIYQQRAIDSASVASIKQQVSQVPSMINRINTKYNDQRNHIIALSADEQLQLLSINLSQDISN